MSDQDQPLQEAPETQDDALQTTIVSTINPAYKKWGISVAIVLVCGVLMYVGVINYLKGRDCTPRQLVQMKWGILDDATIDAMTKNSSAFAMINTQNPVLLLTEVAGLRSDYQKASGEVLCKAPPPPIACAFDTGVCAEDTSGVTPVGARYYAVAYKGSDKFKDVLVDPLQPILGHFTRSPNVQASNDLQYAVISQQSLGASELQAIQPKGYFASDKSSADKQTFTASDAGVSPIRMTFRRYPADTDTALVLSETEVVLLQETLSESVKAAWVHELLNRGYTVFMYPVGEIYVYPVQK